jgi:IS1 family transposase
MIVRANIAILVGPFYPLQGQSHSSWIAPMNILPRDKQIAVISALTEGCSIRAVERLTDIHRDTIMRLGVRVGNDCATLHDAMMRGLHVGRIELDEAWSFIAKKQRHLKPEGPADFGDQYVFLALAGAGKAIISYRVGKRNGENTRAFLADLRSRVLGAPEISSDAFPAYPDAVEQAFGMECSFATIEKHYAADATVEAARRYSPAAVVSVTRKRIIGAQRTISTSYIERQNLTLRMQQRRFTRLTNAFSRKLENHTAAVALYVAHYNFCRVHETLRITPAMQLGVTDHIWTIGELVDVALEGVVPAPNGRRYGRFTVIEGERD